MEVYVKRRQENGPKAEQDKTESPEIPDRGETSEILGLPSGEQWETWLY